MLGTEDIIHEPNRLESCLHGAQSQKGELDENKIKSIINTIRKGGWCLGNTQEYKLNWSGVRRRESRKVSLRTEHLN